VRSAPEVRHAGRSEPQYSQSYPRKKKSLLSELFD